MHSPRQNGGRKEDIPLKKVTGDENHSLSTAPAGGVVALLAGAGRGGSCRPSVPPVLFRVVSRVRGGVGLLAGAVVRVLGCPCSGSRGVRSLRVWLGVRCVCVRLGFRAVRSAVLGSPASWVLGGCALWSLGLRGSGGSRVVLRAWCPGFVGSSRWWWVFALLGVFFVSRFVFSGGRFVSVRSGRVLSGGAAVACARVVARRRAASSVLLRRAVAVCAFRVCPFLSSSVGVRAAFRSFLRVPFSGLVVVAWRARRGLVSSVAGRGWVVLASCGLRVPSPFGAWLRRVGFVVPAGVRVSGPSVSSGAVVPFSPVFAGSRLFLGSPAFLGAVGAGSCPVSLLSSVFAAWPVRSAVLLGLARVLSVAPVPRGAGSGLVPGAVVPGGLVPSLPPSFVSAASSCVRALWRLLGFPALWGAGRVGLLRSLRLSARLSSSPAAPVPPFAFSPSSVSWPAVCSLLSSLARCSWWLVRRSSAVVPCPPALRPAVVSLLRVLLSLGV